MLLCLFWLSILASVNNEQGCTIYTVHPGKGDVLSTTNTRLGVAYAAPPKEVLVQKTEVGPRTLAKLMNIKEYHFKTNGTEYVLYPLDRVMQGGKCIGWLDKITIKKDKIVLVHRNGDLCIGGISNYSTIVEIRPGTEQVAQRTLLPETGNFKFKLVIPELLEVAHVRQVDLFMPLAKVEENEVKQNLVHGVTGSGKPAVIQFTDLSGGTLTVEEILRRLSEGQASTPSKEEQAAASNKSSEVKTEGNTEKGQNTANKPAANKEKEDENEKVNKKKNVL